MGLWLGIEAREAAAFSFLMAVPAIAGAAILQIPDLMRGPSAVPTGTLLVAASAAAVTGVLAIGTFVLLLKRRAFHHFALYLWAAGVAYLTWLALLV
jgi:undecaprenyl-diphosphatase